MNKDDAIETIKRDSINFLFSYGFPSIAIEGIVRDGISAREPIYEKLNMTPDNLYRVAIPIIISNDTKPRLYQFVNEFCDKLGRDTDTKYSVIDLLFIQDERKNKFKITRMIQKHWQLTKTLKSYQEIITEALENDRLEISISSSGACNNFLVWYGDEIASNREIIISGNVFDMLTASSNASFTSCYSPEGSYFNATISNALSPHVFIAYVQSSDCVGHKVGRCWVYVNDSYIIPARKYGAIRKAHSLHIRNYISSRMGGDWILRSGGISKDLMCIKGVAYIDEGKGERLVNKDKAPVHIHTPESVCLFCGGRHRDTGKAGMCNNCAALESMQF